MRPQSNRSLHSHLDQELQTHAIAWPSLLHLSSRTIPQLFALITQTTVTLVHSFLSFHSLFLKCGGTQTASHTPPSIHITHTHYAYTLPRFARGTQTMPPIHTLISVLTVYSFNSQSQIVFAPNIHTGDLYGLDFEFPESWQIYMLTKSLVREQFIWGLDLFLLGLVSFPWCCIQDEDSKMYIHLLLSIDTYEEQWFNTNRMNIYKSWAWSVCLFE